MRPTRSWTPLDERIKPLGPRAAQAVRQRMAQRLQLAETVDRIVAKKKPKITRQYSRGPASASRVVACPEHLDGLQLTATDSVAAVWRLSLEEAATVCGVNAGAAAHGIRKAIRMGVPYKGHTWRISNVENIHTKEAPP